MAKIFNAEDRRWYGRHNKRTEKPPMVFTTSAFCEICHRARAAGGHERCSKIKQKIRAKDDELKAQPKTNE